MSHASTQSLNNHAWRISYTSDSGNPVTDFYIPALERATHYDRKSGFFSSAILSHVASGLGAMLQNAGSNQGKMRLIMGCQLSKADLEAIQQGYTLRDTVAANLEASLTPPANFAQLKRLEILSWLVQTGHLDIKIAIPLKQNGTPLSPDETLDTHYIFHEKVCIFTDVAGHQLVTTGSNNESVGGWTHNIESFHVFCSWEDQREVERVQGEVLRFEQLWNNLTPNVRVFEVPEAVKRKLMRIAPPQKPNWQPQDEFNNRPLKPEEEQRFDPTSQTETDAAESPPADVGSQPENDIDPDALVRERAMFSVIANIHQHPGCLSACLDSIPISPWPHQLKILLQVAKEFPRSFLIADEVGLGKTIETGLVLRYLLLSKKAQRILVLAPASVQPQWQEELREKFNLHFWSYTQGEFKDPYKNTHPASANPWNTKDLVLASSHLVRRKERMNELLDSEPWDLVVLDEAHHARRKSPQARKDTPNRLLELLGKLREKTKALILLSATPMQIDPIEIFDLLNVLGLGGHWAYGDQFCEYFASLGNRPDRQLLNFWQIMSSDYFNQGGVPSPRLQQHLRQQDRMLASRVEDFWRGRTKIVNDRSYLQDEAFISTSRQFLSTNTPLKDMMFRHTRDTLRQYYRLGLLDKDVPTREVCDNAITLEPTREAELYREVSNYVRHFYRLAQKENRKALGFLMTLYRKRLTSSFYAIQQSLQRRLDALVGKSGSGLTADDLTELEDADDAVIEGLESFMEEPIHPEELEKLESLLRQFDNTGEDSKLAHFITILRQELATRESVIAFTQYTDTMDFLRETVRQTYGAQVSCYSGRGGEMWREGKWTIVPKEEIKRRFRDGEIKILLCTESASEGLNLQTCGVLINYDMPWNPMRVEQRIGRIDRIGQTYSTVRIHNFYYDGTVEAKVYRKLRDRIDAFSSVVGNLQPILAQVPTFIAKAMESVDSEEEDVLLSEFEAVLDAPPIRPALEDMVRMDVEADLKEIRKPLPAAPVTAAGIQELFVRSHLLKAKGIEFSEVETGIWDLKHKGTTYQVTFNPTLFEEKPSLRLMNWGEPLFDRLVGYVYETLG